MSHGQEKIAALGRGSGGHWRCGWPIGVAVLLAAAGSLGCSGKQTAQVSGRVQYKDGSPITGGVRIIRFEPTVDSTAVVRKAASSEIGTDGTFQVYTRRPGDGVYLGSYAVTFTVLTSPMGGKSLIKPEYGSADTTPYTVEVTGDMEDLVYEIEPL